MHKLFKSAVLIAVCVCSAVAQAQTLKIATVVPEGSAWMKSMRDGAAEIKQGTAGRVELKIYGGGVQGSDKQVQRKMRTGQLHGGAFTAGALSTFQQDAGIYSLGLLFRNHAEVQHVRQQLDAELAARLYDAGYVSFGFAGGGFAYMMSRKPLRTAKDMFGQKVWTPEGDELAFKALQAIGVAPVSMPITDVMTGLQTDLLDSVAVPPVGAVVLQWHTRLKYISDLPLAYVYAAILIDRKAFERLQPDDQFLVRGVLERVYQGFETSGQSDNAAALQALQSSGLELIEADATEIDSWQEKVTLANVELAEAGKIDAQLLQQIHQLLAEYRSRSGS